MAMATYLQLVSQDELRTLESNPAAINELDQPVDFRTHFAGALNYFITGSAWPDEQPLAPILFGSRNVDTPTLENGSFGIIDAAEVGALLAGLEAVDPAALQKAVESADLDALIEDEELYELEVIDPAELPGELVRALTELVGFYKQVAAAGGAIVSYTT